MSEELEKNEPIESEEEEMTLDKIEKLSSLIQSEGIKSTLLENKAKIEDSKNQLFGTIKGLSAEKDFIQERLDTYTLEELKAYLQSDDNVRKFYTDDDGNEVGVSLPFDTPGKELEFKKELLLLIKHSDESYKMIDEEFEKMDKATNEISAEIEEACVVLSDNVLSYVSLLKDKAAELTDEIQKNKLLRTCRYIEAGYNFEIYKEAYGQIKSAARKAVEETAKKSYNDIAYIGRKYTNKLSSNNAKVSLIPLLSNTEPEVMSLEEYVLVKDIEYTVPDLLVYSIIRFFAMTDWTPDVKRLHATTALVLKRLKGNEFEEEIKARVINDIIDYLNGFKPYIN